MCRTMAVARTNPVDKENAVAEKRVNFSFFIDWFYDIVFIFNEYSMNENKWTKRTKNNENGKTAGPNRIRCNSRSLVSAENDCIVFDGNTVRDTMRSHLLLNSSRGARLTVAHTANCCSRFPFHSNDSWPEYTEALMCGVYKQHLRFFIPTLKTELTQEQWKRIRDIPEITVRNPLCNWIFTRRIRKSYCRLSAWWSLACFNFCVIFPFSSRSNVSACTDLSSCPTFYLNFDFFFLLFFFLFFFGIEKERFSISRCDSVIPHKRAKKKCIFFQTEEICSE